LYFDAADTHANKVQNKIRALTIVVEFNEKLPKEINVFYGIKNNYIWGTTVQKNFENLGVKTITVFE
jgi:hypothetical protein